MFNPDGKISTTTQINLEPQTPSSNGFDNYGYRYVFVLVIGTDVESGPYQIVTHYDKWRSSETVLYDPNHTNYDRYYTYNAFFENTTYPTRYKLTNGNELEGLDMDNTNKILYIQAMGVENKTGKLVLELPRNIIDSRYDNGTDKNYAVTMEVMGGAIVQTNNSEEIQKNNQNRTLQFDIPPYNATYIIMLHGTTINPTKISEYSILSPLKQFLSGTLVHDIKCGQGFQLVIKSENDSPACVKPTTVNILIERGWAKPI